MKTRHAQVSVAALTTLAAPMGLALFLYRATGEPRGGSLLPPVPIPDGNPITEEKRVLGKILFFDEQLSTDNTVACATCHQMTNNGADPRIAIHPGLDAILGTPDDIRGSAGVIRQDDQTNYEPDPLFVLSPQVTTRSANSVINAAYHRELFWDGRAPETLTDPDSGVEVLGNNAALESQTLAPPLSSVEMAHAGRDWSQVTTKLAHARPLALASNVPPDIADAVLDAGSYPELFARAFGDSAITPERIAMAVATYERTLISDQSPWDAFVQGDTNALTAAEARGWAAFQANQCAVCHTPPLFTNDEFRNIGVRPLIEDNGRQAVTGDPADRGKFKVPGLRNTGLKRTYMHNGEFGNLTTVVGFYAGNGQVPDNLDPVIPLINFPPQVAADITAFLQNGLTDPRVANGEFPFDAPDLFFRPGAPFNPQVLGPNTARPDSQGRVPQVVARTPPLIGSDDFRVGVRNVADGATVTLVMSMTPPVNGEVPPDTVIATLTAEGDDPVATAHWPIAFSRTLNGQSLFMQWRVDDPNLDEPALSRAFRADLFCGFGDCSTGCAADFNRDQRVNFFDIAEFIAAYGRGDSKADMALPLGAFNFFDVAEFIGVFGEGCP